MQKASQEYKDSMKGLLRNQSYIKIGFSIIDQDAKNTTSYNANNEETFSNLVNINDGTPVNGTYITFEKGRYQVGNKQIIYNNEDYLVQSYVSDSVADENGLFDVNPMIEITSSQPLNTIGFTFEFDGILEEHPLELHILAYLSDNLVSDIYLPITNHFYVIEHHIEAWDKLQIEYTKVLPYHRARMDSIVFGVTKYFENDVVLNSTMIRNCSPIANEIAQNSFEFELDNFSQLYNPDNPSNIYKYVEEEQEIDVQYGYDVKDDGNIEWINGGKYVLDGMPSVKENSVVFKSLDVLGSLTDIFYKGMYHETPISMYDLALEVLRDAGLKDEEFILNDHMKTIYTKAPLPVVTHKECLQIIANASQCLLIVNRDGKIAFSVAIDPQIDITDNGGTSYSNSAIAYNFPSLITTTILTSEKDWWKVGDNKQIYENDDIVQGFISANISNESGLFEVNPQVTVEYSFGIELYEIPLKFGGNVYDFNVYYYNGNELLSTINVVDNNELEYKIYNQVYNCNKVVYEMVRVKPYQRARINAIGVGRVNDYYVDFNTSYAKPLVNKKEPLYAVDVNSYYFTEGEQFEIFNDVVTVNGEISLKIQYDMATNINISISDGFSVESVTYTQYAIIMIKGNGNCNLVILGNKLEKSSLIVSNVVGLKGETKTLENPIITDTDNAKKVGEWITSWLLKRNEYDIEYRGEPCVDAYDVIYAQSQFEEYIPVRVVKNTIKFNGSLSGTINVRRT